MRYTIYLPTNRCGSRCKKETKQNRKLLGLSSAEFKMLVLLAVCVTIMLANPFFVKAVKPEEVLEIKQASTSMAASSKVGLICPDPKWTCPDSQPCCYSSGGWRCCPYTGGTCCAGGLQCCPSGQMCIWNLWCL